MKIKKLKLSLVLSLALFISAIGVLKESNKGAFIGYLASRHNGGGLQTISVALWGGVGAWAGAEYGAGLGIAFGGPVGGIVGGAAGAF